MAVQKIGSESFEKAVLNSSIPVLVDFYADWCGPCKMLSPVVHELAAEHDDFAVFQMNVDESMDIAMRYGISSIPALLVFRGGEVKARSVGFQGKEQLLQLVESAK